jgi:hypothetical protein
MLAHDGVPPETREQLQEREALLLMAEICNTAMSYSRVAHRQGDKLNPMQAFQQVLARTSLTADDLLSIWAVFMLGAQAVKQRHRALAEEQQAK